MNLHKQKEKINALSIRMITWADRAKVPISNQENHIPEVDNAGNIVKYHKKPDGYYVVYNKEKKQQLRKWSDDFKWVSKKEFRLKQLIDVQEMTDEKHSAGVIQVDGLNKKEMRKANMLYDIYNPDQILMR
jgi:hypothetical protein